MATALSEDSDSVKRVVDTLRSTNTSDKENHSHEYLKHGLQRIDE
jgi:hypothetical protein